MKKTVASTILTASAVMLLGAVFASSASANCVPPQLFRSSGKFGDNVRIDVGSAENAGTEIGRFWQSSLSLAGNNFNGECPSQNGDDGWWDPADADLRYIDGITGTEACNPVQCPSGSMTLIVEDKSVSGDDALFIGFQVDETPPEARWWDFARVDPSPAPSVLTMLPFPEPDVLSTSQIGGGLVRMEMLLADVAPNVHAVHGPNDDLLPASSVVSSYDIYQHIGPGGEPGRNVEDWTLLQSVPYEDGPATVSIDVSCEESWQLAIGVSFEGGDGPDVVSTYVGKSLSIECGLDPTVIADAGPDQTAECAGPDGTPVMLDGSGTDGADHVEWSADGIVFDDPHLLMPTGTFPTGTTEVLLVAVGNGFVDSDTTLVTVRDETEPVLTCALSAAGGGPDDEGDDSPRLAISLTADDICCGETEVTAAIELGWASLPVVDGQVITLACPGYGDDEADDCPRVGFCDDHLTIRSADAKLVGVATDCNGNVGSCELELCDPPSGSSDKAVETTPHGDLGRRVFGLSAR